MRKQNQILLTFLLLLGTFKVSDAVLFKAHDFSGWFPPDGGLAVSSTRIVSAVNGDVALFDKDNLEKLDGTSLIKFFNKGDSFDPRVVFDAEKGKFVVVCVNGRSPGRSYVEFAISKSSSIGSLSADDWNFGTFKVPEDTVWLDYPMIGIDSYNVYITGNMFDSRGVGNGGRLYIFKKQFVYFGNTKEYWGYNIRDLPFGNHHGVFRGSPYTVQPAWNWNRGNQLQYLFSKNGGDIYVITVGNLESRGKFTFNVYLLRTPPVGTYLLDAPQKGTDQYLVQTNDVRFAEAMLVDNKLVVSHTARNLETGRAMIRIYLVDTTSEETPSLTFMEEYQQPEGTWYYYPAVGVNSEETLGMMAIRSSEDEYISLAVAEKRKDEDVFGVPKIVKTSTSFHARNRFGDYSSIALDPDDLKTFWYLGEISPHPSRWEVWIYSNQNETEEEEIDCGPHGTLHQDRCWCGPGYTGDLCSECRHGKDPDNPEECLICPENCNDRGKCNRATGVCTCLGNFAGRACQRCVDGWTGANCQIQLLDCGSHGTQVGTICVCQEGWTGEDCSEETSICLNGVLQEDGTCLCRPGWMGKMCSECLPDYWGPECLLCPWCGPHGVCNKNTGECDCHLGWKDGRCQTCSWWNIPLSEGRECECGYCGPYGKCNKNTGKCDCLPGWEGPNCAWCSGALPCGIHGKCVDNSCVCQNGYSGWYCTY